MKVNPLDLAAYRALCDAETLAELAVLTGSTESQLVQLREQLEVKLRKAPAIPKSAAPLNAPPTPSNLELLAANFDDEEIGTLLEAAAIALTEYPNDVADQTDLRENHIADLGQRLTKALNP